MILRRGKVVAFGNMRELRDQFGSFTYTVFFSIDDFEKLALSQKPCRKEAGFFICEAEDIKELNELTRIITESGGSVEKIESRYPSLEEMLVKIGI
jgi:ABC-2 type transport system ATP-binding protein